VPRLELQRIAHVLACGLPLSPGRIAVLVGQLVLTAAQPHHAAREVGGIVVDAAAPLDAVRLVDAGIVGVLLYELAFGV
jgi:hypothetical protein